MYSLKSSTRNSQPAIGWGWASFDVAVLESTFLTFHFTELHTIDLRRERGPDGVQVVHVRLHVAE